MQLKNKKEQTYEEALEAMNTRATKLTEVSKRHYTPELLTAAIRNGCGLLSQIPKEKRTKELCMESMKMRFYEDFPYIPKEHFDFDFCLECLSWAPRSLWSVMHIFREGREKGPYTQQDVALVAEAACPRKLGADVLAAEGGAEENLKGESFETWCSRRVGFVDSSMALLMSQALLAMQREMSGEFVLAETPLGALVGKRATDSEHPGVYIDLHRDGEQMDAPVLLVEFANDDADLEKGDRLITRVWDAVDEESYRTRVVHTGIDNYFAEKEAE